MAGRLGLDTSNAQCLEISQFDNGIDRPHHIAVADQILQSFRKHRRLVLVLSLHKHKKLLAATGHFPKATGNLYSLLILPSRRGVADNTIGCKILLLPKYLTKDKVHCNSLLPKRGGRCHAIKRIVFVGQ
jgi:hypothetical protein